MSYFKKATKDPQSLWLQLIKVVDQKEYSKALLMQMGLVDGYLRSKIESLLPNEARFKKYIDNERLLFGTLIDYAELLNLPENEIKKLREYNEFRIKILHGSQNYSIKENFESDIERMCILGREILGFLMP